MTDITVFDPWTDRFNTAVKRLFNAPMLFNEDESLRDMQLKIDVTEDDKEYVVHADIPGVQKENIRVDISGNQVSISAKAKTSKEEKSKNYVCSERYEGNVYRSFRLDCDIDEANAKAKYTDGVLELTLPKLENSQRSKSLTIQ